MRIAVINEVSASTKNQDIIKALTSVGCADIYNVGMKNPEQLPELTYIHTGLMSALLLNAEAVDVVIGGCGTGQGYLNSVLQYPGVTCGLITNPLDAWLFSQINAGNCLSLALNKGYGWAGDINLEYIFREYFKDVPGAGFPAHRQQSQKESRELLGQISVNSHKSIEEILSVMNKSVLTAIAGSKDFMYLLETTDKGKKIAMQFFK